MGGPEVIVSMSIGSPVRRAATAVVVMHIAVNRCADGLESSLSQRRARVVKWNRRAEVRAQARSAQPRFVVDGLVAVTHVFAGGAVDKR